MEKMKIKDVKVGKLVVVTTKCPYCGYEETPSLNRLNDMAVLGNVSCYVCVRRIDTSTIKSDIAKFVAKEEI